MRSRTSELIDQLHRAFDGEPWHGPSICELLRSIAAPQAEARPVPGVHTIAEITAHLAAWTDEVARRLGGQPAGAPPEGDWPESRASTSEGWAAMTLEFARAIARLERAIATLPPAKWDGPVADARQPGTTPVTHAQLVLGLIQHLAYHGGQIALLRRAVGAAEDA